ncbi:hypothetical protein pipiens_013426 [Culex pipiens pipiens]|uniref:Amyloid protein-binding protein 2 n=1 Tax=Culex pipiens pipiens TaxID=38569 RepID=A0ABD1CYK4_CULPP
MDLKTSFSPTTSSSSTPPSSSSSLAPATVPSRSILRACDHKDLTFEQYIWKVWVILQTKSYKPHDVQILPVAPMVETLDAMCHRLDLIEQFSTVLFDPYTISKILKHFPYARVKLVKYFQWLEKIKGNFVWQLAQKVSDEVDRSWGNRRAMHLLGYSSNLRLGTMLMETGWFAESIIVLDLAQQQAGYEPVKTLQVLRVLLMSESFSGQHEVASDTIKHIEALLCQPVSLTTNLVAALHQAMSVSFFENCEFDLSYQHGLIALRLLGEQVCVSSTIINTYRQMARCCIAKKRSHQANLMITQAVIWARQAFGMTSVYYAEVLEDYAFCLLAMNKNYLQVYDDAMEIYLAKYGEDFSRLDVAQGNLALGLFIRKERLAAKRVKALDLAVREYQSMFNPLLDMDETEDEFSNRVERLAISVVQNEFQILDFMP